MDNQNQDLENQSKEDINQLEDNEVIKRILEGEKELYALLIRKYNQRLYRVGMSIVNDQAEVEDVMQVVYIKAYENLAKFKFKSSFATWLTKILVNESLLQKKKKEQTTKRQSNKVLREIGLSAVELQTPLMKVLNDELKVILESSIRQLPEKYRTVFIMREMENMSISETMECLGISEANVKVRLNRARVMLRDILRNYLKDDEILQLYQPRCDRMVDDVMNIINKRKL
jgi:RNA polymerase sigma factor (sigma-70 family)